VKANVRHFAEPTPEFFLSMSALIDKNGDEILEATEAADFSFGGVHTASVEMGREWVAQADLNNDGILTMREVADGHAKLTIHALTKRWLESTAVVEATLRLLQRETARVRKSLPASEVDATEAEGTAGINQSSASSVLPPAAGKLTMLRLIRGILVGCHSGRIRIARLLIQATGPLNGAKLSCNASHHRGCLLANAGGSSSCRNWHSHLC